MPSDMSDEPSRRVQARSEREAHVEAGRDARIAPGRAKQRGDAGLHAARANPPQALRDQDAVVRIELHHVGDRAERDQVEQAVEARLGMRVGEGVAAAQFRPQREQHVEHHADARDALARKRAARLVRIDDRARGRQFVARQVVIGDEHVDAERVRRLDAVDARDAVVHRDQQVGLARRDGARPVRRSRASARSRIRSGSARDSRSARRTCAGRARRRRRRSRRRSRSRRRPACGACAASASASTTAASSQPLSPAGACSCFEFGLDLVRRRHAARRVKPRDHRMQAVAHQDFGIGGGAGAGDDSGHAEVSR